MIQRAGTMETEYREKMKDGQGTIAVTHLLKQIQMKGQCRFFGRMIIEPGCSIGLHRHTDEEEIYYIMKGKGMVEDNGINQEVSVGDVILTGDGATHSIANRTNDTLEVLGIILLY